MTVLKQEQLFDEIDLLPIDIKTKIVDKILNSINPIDKSMDDLWIKEVNKRKNEIESSKVALVSGDEVFRKIANRLK
ncbi:MAG: addiction module protein [Aliarcobacter sp.]|nr:addiction module protein [Aliarcobacter sp.]